MKPTRRSMLALLAPIGLALLLGCNAFGINNTRILEVAAYKGHCFGLFEGLCLQVRDPGEADYRNLFDAPSGFAYEWGFEYVIVVEEHEIDNPPADGSSVRRRFDHQLSKIPVAPGTQFELNIPPAFLTVEGEGRYRILGDGPELICTGTLPCSELDTLVEGGTRLGFTLAFSPQPGGPIQVVAWALCPEDIFAPCGGS